MAVRAPLTPRDGARRTGFCLLSAALFAVVGVGALRVRGGTAPLHVDQQASQILGSARLGRLVARTSGIAPWPNGQMRHVVAYGLPLGAVAIALGLAVVAWRRRDVRAAVLCLLGPALAVVLTDDVLKPLVDRHHGSGLAYPSGHATGAAAVAVLAVILFHRWGGRRATVLFAPVAFALPAVMGVALVRLGWHYPTDVVGGTAMGAATVIALAVALKVHVEAVRERTPADRRTALEVG